MRPEAGERAVAVGDRVAIDAAMRAGVVGGAVRAGHARGGRRVCTEFAGEDRRVITPPGGGGPEAGARLLQRSRGWGEGKDGVWGGGGIARSGEWRGNGGAPPHLVEMGQQ